MALDLDTFCAQKMAAEKQMKILHVLPFVAPRYGGSSTGILSLCKSLSELGVDVSIFTTNIDGKYDLDVPLGQEIIQDGYKITYFQVLQPRYFFYSFQMARALRIRIREFDLVHITTIYSFAALMAVRHCRKHKIPYIMNVAGDLNPYLLNWHAWRKKLYWKFTLRRDLELAEAIHYKCEGEVENARPLNLLVPAVIVPNGINIEEFRNLPPKGEFRKKNTVTADKYIILFLGRLSYVKGLDRLVEAFEELALKRNDLSLVLVGPDDEGFYGRIGKLIENEEILTRIVYAGALYKEEKLAVLQDADLLVLPSFSENFAISVIEAMSVGLPVVMSKTTNLSKELHRAKSALIVDCERKELVKGIENLLNDPQLRSQLSANGKRLVHERYTCEKSAEQMYRGYAEIIQQFSQKWEKSIPLQ